MQKLRVVLGSVRVAERREIPAALSIETVEGVQVCEMVSSLPIEEVKRYAELMAAAPELLAALEFAEAKLGEDANRNLHWVLGKIKTTLHLR